MFKVTRDAFVKAIEEAVEKEGADKCFPRNDEGCRYFDEDGKPVCIVGHALAIMGMEPFDVGASANSQRFYALADENHFTHSVDVEDQCLIDAIDAAQREQDDGATWGHALSVFHDGLGRQL